jgi:hypothetical protein
MDAIMTQAQETAIRSLCERFHVEFDAANYHPQFDLPAGYIAGWVGPIYMGCSADGEISS